MYSEEDNIYDSSKTEYQNASLDSTDPSSLEEGKFNSKLQKLYKSVRETLHYSKTILNRNEPQSTENSQIRISYDTTKRDSNMIDLKLNGQTSNNDEFLNSTSVNRTQNDYVVLPNMNESSLLNKSELSGELLGNGKLTIHEVSYGDLNFDLVLDKTLIDYLMKKVSLDSHTIQIDETPIKSENKICIQGGDPEIYQSINDIEAYMKIENKKIDQSEEKECQYSTPSNIRFLNNSDMPNGIGNCSQMQLLDDDEEDDEQEAEVKNPEIKI